MNYRTYDTNIACKRDNPTYFKKGKDRAHGVKERVFYKMNKSERRYMYELTVLTASTGEEMVTHALRELSTGFEGRCYIGGPMGFATKKEALDAMTKTLEDDQAIIEQFSKWADTLKGGFGACEEVRVASDRETGMRYVIFKHMDGEYNGTKRYPVALLFDTVPRG